VINFKLEKYSNKHYNLTFMKKVHKRNGEVVEEPDDTLYTLPLSRVKYRIAYNNTINKFEDQDISLKEYLLEFFKSYKEVCELLKKTL